MGPEAPTPNPADYEKLIRAQLRAPAPERFPPLSEAAWEVPRTSPWVQLRTRQPLVSVREAKCQRTRFARDAPVIASRGPSGKWNLKGVISCAKLTCPICGRRRARAVSGKLGACFDRHLEVSPDGDYWMLTLTAPHRAEDAPAAVLGWLYQAATRFWRSAAWRELVERWGIVARVRVLDATHGGQHGLHPHFHVALFPTRVTAHSWRLLELERDVLVRSLGDGNRARRREARERRSMRTNAERADDATWAADAVVRLAELDELIDKARAEPTSERVRMVSQSTRRAFLRELVWPLLAAWRDSLRSVGCPHSAGSHAVDLLPSEKAEAYYLKWGLAEEIGLSTEKDRSHLRLLDIVGARVGRDSDAAADHYRRFVVASRGRAWVTGLADACRGLGVTDEDADAFVERMRERRRAELERAGEPVPPVLPRMSVEIRAHLWRAFLTQDPETVFGWLDARAAEMEPPRVQLAFDDFLWRLLPVTQRCDTS